MLENSYNPDHFLIELAEGDGYYDHTNASNKSMSAYLHEYMHYVQDTATYYGCQLRTERMSGNNNLDVIGAGANDLFLPLCFGVLNIENDKLYFEEEKKSLLGSLALKECMAQEAERYVFGEKSVQNCTAVMYRGIMTVIIRVLPSLTKTSLLRFVVEECCLMTTNPVGALIKLISTLYNTEIDNRLTNESEEELAKWLHEECESILARANLLSYGVMKSFDNVQISMQRNTMSKVASVMFSSQQEMNSNPERLQCAYNHIETFRQDNLNKRLDNHFIIIQSLIQYKQKLDINVWHKEFGFPIVRFKDATGKMKNNETDFSNCE